MNVAVDFENLDQWARELDQALQDMQVKAETSLLRLGERIAILQERAAPDRSRVDPDFTIQAGRAGTVSYVDVGPDPWQGIRLAHYEFGTRRQPPRPFMRRIVYEQAANWDPMR